MSAFSLTSLRRGLVKTSPILLVGVLRNPSDPSGFGDFGEV
jgi:hypothetical protein